MIKTRDDSIIEIWGATYLSVPNQRYGDDKHKVVIQAEKGNDDNYIVEIIDKDKITAAETAAAAAVKIQLDKGAIMPTRAHPTDAGLDLYAKTGELIPAGKSAIFDTGVHIQLPPQTVGMLKSKSGLNVRFGITSEGVIDVGYTGSIVAKLYNNSACDYRVNAGDKITQLVIMPIYTPALEVVESLEETERGAGGLGSTGK